MKKTTFTDTMIRKLKPEKSDYTRSEGNGFTVRVMPTGVKTWLYLFEVDGRRRKMNLGQYPDVTLETARQKFEDAKRKVKNGIDPMAEEQDKRLERKRTPTVSDFVEEFIDRHAKVKTRGWKEVERALKAEIVPELGYKKMTDVRRRDLIVILDKVVTRAPIMANRLLAYTRKMFSFALSRDVIEVNPFMGIESPAQKVERERNLSEDEIKTLWRNLDTANMSDEVKRILKLILVTGQRPGEVIGIHRQEIDGRWWTIPAERSKNHVANRVYLTDTALELISDKDGFIFESPVNKGMSLEVRTLTHAIKANLPHTPESKVVDRLCIPHFVPHDLRRTTASRMAESGINGDLIERIQNHVQKKGVAHIYNRYDYGKEKQAALESWERKLQAIITGKGMDNVVSITMARKAA